MGNGVKLSALPNSFSVWFWCVEVHRTYINMKYQLILSEFKIIRYTDCFCCGRITADNLIHILSLKRHFTHLQPAINQNHIFYDPSSLIHELSPQYTQSDLQQGSSSSSVKYQCIFMYANSVDGTDDCEITGQKVQQLRTTSLSLSKDKCHCLIWRL